MLPAYLGRDYAILVPQVDASTGLTRAGLRSVEARLAAGDTRPSLEELYVDQAGYVAAVTAAATSLVADRTLLQRDADLIIARAVANPVLP